MCISDTVDAITGGLWCTDVLEYFTLSAISTTGLVFFLKSLDNLFMHMQSHCKLMHKNTQLYT